VYLTAICSGLTSGYSAVLLPQLRANNSGFEMNEEIESWIGKSMNLFLLNRTQGRTQSGAFENGAQRGVSGAKREEATGGWGKLMMRGFINCTVRQILFTR
jgi:hypothetical protein